MANLGYPVDIDDDIKDILGDVSSRGYVNLFLGDSDEGVVINGEIVARKDITYDVEVGDNVHYDNMYEPPTMEYGSRFFDMMDAFKSGDAISTNRYAEKCWGYELELVDDNSVADILSGAESNLEYCMMNDTVVKEAFSEGVSLLNPSRGTVSRLITNNLIQYVRDVFVIKGSDSDYIDAVRIICSEIDIKVKIIPEKEINRDTNYYLSFNGDYGEKYKLSNFFGCVINPYQAVYNEICTSVSYDDTGVGLEYRRRDQQKKIWCYYRNKFFLYGSDYLYERYKNTKTFKMSCAMMYDIVSSYVLSFGKNKILRSRIPIANCLCLIGDYHDDGYNIYKGREMVYSTSSAVHSSITLHEDWQPLEGNQIQLQRASYVIGIFSSVCVKLGPKLYVVNDGEKIAKYRGSDIRVSSVYSHGANVLGYDLRGEYLVGDDKYIEVEKIPYNSNIVDYFSGGSYCYGTYHTIVRSVNYVGDEKSISQIVNEGL